MKFVRIILSWLYGAVVTVRNILYDEHLLLSCESDIPTICVGNLAVGGTGKTLLVAYIAGELSKRMNVAILSRGYKRSTCGFVLAEDASTASDIGDEPAELHRKLPGVVLAVCENRVAGIRRLRKMYPELHVVILDDAFQHRRLKCGFNILLTTADNLYVNDYFLPYGKLRDSKQSASRANVIVVSKCKDSMQPIERRIIETSLRLPIYQKLFFSYLRYGDLLPLRDWGRPQELSAFDKQHPLILSAIANAAPLHEYLQKMFPETEQIEFADHHKFTRADIEMIRNKFVNSGCDCIITTEKDAARIVAMKSFPDDLYDCTYVQPMEIDFRRESESFMKIIMQYMTESNRK